MARRKQAAAAPADANAHRGEHLLDLGGRSWRLRPSHSALVAIERETERSVLVLVRAGNAGELTLPQLGTIAAQLIRAGADDALDRAVSAERIGELIFEEGLPRVTARLTLCLFDAATGGRTASGEAKAATAVTTDAGAA